MNKNETILLGAACFFAGAVAGFLIAPIKKGIYCGNNSGNNYADKNGDDNEEKIYNNTQLNLYAAKEKYNSLPSPNIETICLGNN